MSLPGSAASLSTLSIATANRYGKGRGHPGQLDIGDRFAYPCAREHGTPLL